MPKMITRHSYENNLNLKSFSASPSIMFWHPIKLEMFENMLPRIVLESVFSF